MVGSHDGVEQMVLSLRIKSAPAGVVQPMQLLFPVFLAASLAIAIPIVVHLFYFRRFRKVYFTNVRFLKEIKEQKTSRSRLRNLLVLAMRILAVLALVLAFAQPFIPQGESGNSGPKAVGIYVDNSFSMQSLSQDVPLLDLAKAKARQVIEGYGPQDRFQVMSNDFSAKGQRLVGKEEALTLVDEIGVSAHSPTLRSVLMRQRQTLSATGDRKAFAYLISDFQETGQDTELPIDSLVEWVAIPLKAMREQNVSIDSVWFEGPVLVSRQPNTLLVKVSNHGEAPIEQVRLAIMEGGQEKPIGSLSIPGNSSLTDTVVFTPQVSGWQHIEFRINDYPIQFDDRYHVAAEVLEKVRVLVIQDREPSVFLQRGIQGLGAMQTDFLPAVRIDYGSINAYQLVILDGLPSITSGLKEGLTSYMQEGGNVLVLPPAARPSLPGYDEFLVGAGAKTLSGWTETEKEAGQLNTSTFVFRDVYLNAGANLTLPRTRGQYALVGASAAGEEKLLAFRDGQTFIGRYGQGQGNLYVSCSPLDPAYNDLGRSGEIFVPMVYRMALSSGGGVAQALTLGQEEEAILQVPAGVRTEKPLRLRSEKMEFVPRQRFVGSRVRIGLQDGVGDAGSYVLSTEKNDTLGMLGLNFDRKESVQRFLDADALGALGVEVLQETEVADLTAWVSEQERGIALWRWCVILALAFLAAETLLLRFWKA